MLRWVNWLTTKAARDTSSGQFIAEIDGLRFIAIFSVILYHLSEMVVVKTGRNAESDPLVSLLSHGDIGVQLFFVISGFVIALPFAKGYLSGARVPRIRQYFLRRLTRLEPPYIFSLLARFMLLVFLTDKTTEELLPRLLSSMAYLHNIIYGEKSVINVVAWSLEVELQFYILAPLLATVFMIPSKVYRRGAIISLIAIFAAMPFFVGSFPRYNLSVLSSAQFFLTGFLLVDVYLNEMAHERETSVLWDFVSVLAWICVGVALLQGRAGKVLIALPIFVAYVAAFKGRWSNRILCQPFIYITGGMCYTIYLYHFTIINIIGRLLAGFLGLFPLWFAIIVASLILLPIIFILSTLLFVLIEKPCMNKDLPQLLLKRTAFTARSLGRQLYNLK